MIRLCSCGRRLFPRRILVNSVPIRSGVVNRCRCARDVQQTQIIQWMVVVGGCVLPTTSVIAVIEVSMITPIELRLRHHGSTQSPWRSRT